MGKFHAERALDMQAWHGNKSRTVKAHHAVWAAALLAGGIWVGTAVHSRHSRVQAEIEAAARAPLISVADRHSRALCADFTATVAAHLVGNGSPQQGCVQMVQTVFSETVRSPQRLRHLYTRVRVASLSWRDDEGHATLALGSGRDHLSLRRVGARWLVSSPARLHALPECNSDAPATKCASGSKVPVLVMGVFTHGGRFESRISPPSAVKRAGRRAVREFIAGRDVMAQSGCEACHRIGANGNRGPGPALTHIGSRLTEREIRHALLYPKAPMPSFRALPHAKLHALVRFLAMLR